MTNSEKKTLLRMLHSMTEFIMKTGGKSLISRIYGLYMVEYPGMNKIYLMLQRNNIQLQKSNELQNIFDLKGSTFSRRVIDPLDLKVVKDKTETDIDLSMMNKDMFSAQMRIGTLKS